MTQTRFDLPWNFPADWDAPEFMDGEIPVLVMEEGARIIGTQRVLVESGMRTAPDHRLKKVGVACHRLGWLFDDYRQEIVDAIRRARGSRRGEEGRF